jgi:drug/metabolite transporter (DMT)-like permease
MFAGETMGWHTAVGGAAIIGGVALTLVNVKKREESGVNREGAA